MELSVRLLQASEHSAAQIDWSPLARAGAAYASGRGRTDFVAGVCANAGLIVGCGEWSYCRTLFGREHGSNRETTILDSVQDAAKTQAIFMHPDWTRQGLGSMILTYCKQVPQQAGFRIVEVDRP
jgi:GNAT superfamily N-acetyltransferase